jgi:hypothetical protein
VGGGSKGTYWFYFMVLKWLALEGNCGMQEALHECSLRNQSHGASMHWTDRHCAESWGLTISPDWLCHKTLTVLVQSVIRRLPNSLCPTGRNPWQDPWV